MGPRCRHASPATPLRGRDVCAGMHASHTPSEFARPRKATPDALLARWRSMRKGPWPALDYGVAEGPANPARRRRKFSMYKSLS